MPVCGDSKLDEPEQCDLDSPGCKDCKIVKGYECNTQTCTLKCGDGIVITEDCDDGNSILNDGCSDCRIDFNY